MTGFDGFPEEALDFYEDLETDNTKAYWTDHKAAYDRSVRRPLEALLEELEPEFGPAKIFRPYRDVRFSKDKTPYKTAAGAIVGGRFYVQLSAAGLYAAAGAYGLSTVQSRRLRAAIADPPGAILAPVLDTLERAGFTVEGQRLKRLPKDLLDHPRADLLTLKTLYAGRLDPPVEWLHTRAALDRVQDTWRALGPLNDWLAQHVGAE